MEYLYIVLAILSLVWRWYKKQQEKNDSPISEDGDNSKPSATDASEAFESLIAQFEEAYGGPKTASPAPVKSTPKTEIENNDAFQTKRAPKESVGNTVSNSSNRYQNYEGENVQVKPTKRVSKSTQPTQKQPQSTPATEFDLEQMVISAAILDRPYK